MRDMTIDGSTIQEIVEHILEAACPDRVSLFGSAVTGEMASDSDIDLLVIEEQVVNPRVKSLRVRSALAGLNFPVDVILMTSERFMETKDVIGGIAYPANRYGRVIYEAA